MKKPNEVRLLCCHGSVAKVTKRRTKLWERPRNHTCKGCGRWYRVGPDLKPVEVR